MIFLHQRTDLLTFFNFTAKAYLNDIDSHFEVCSNSGALNYTR